MRLRYRILTGVTGVLVLAAGVFAAVISHDSACGELPPPAAGTEHMKAVVLPCYGPPSVLRVEEVAKPTPAPTRMLVKVHAASVNPADWHFMRGSPYVMRLGAGIGAP